MARILSALCVAALLSGCVVLPLDYDHRGGRHEHRHHGDRWGDRHHHGDRWGDRYHHDGGGYWHYRDRRR